jgi:hypothetical protein
MLSLCLSFLEQQREDTGILEVSLWTSVLNFMDSLILLKK